MGNKIIAIQEFDSADPVGGSIVDLVADRLSGKVDESGGFMGWRIVCTDEIIFLGVDNSQSCCENFGAFAHFQHGEGYVQTLDRVEDFVGAEVIRVERVSKFLSVTEAPPHGDLDSGGAIYVNVHTDRGLLQFTVYNAHNGYYGHSAVFISRHGREEESL